jgi:hypothetical protein
MIYILVSLHPLVFTHLSVFVLKLVGHISVLFIQEHYPEKPDIDFHKYITRAVEYEFKRVVGIRLVYSEKGSMFP